MFCTDCERLVTLQTVRYSVTKPTQAIFYKFDETLCIHARSNTVPLLETRSGCSQWDTLLHISTSCTVLSVFYYWVYIFGGMTPDMENRATEMRAIPDAFSDGSRGTDMRMRDTQAHITDGTLNQLNAVPKAQTLIRQYVRSIRKHIVLQQITQVIQLDVVGCVSLAANHLT